mmetsp:Transcript_12269/g.28878  ORF Transcript_12269/g.28878 Transcript_12269/m.28878 type:complete len:212 (+) Transcript_12269:214-849(+)
MNSSTWKAVTCLPSRMKMLAEGLTLAKPSGLVPAAAPPAVGLTKKNLLMRCRLAASSCTLRSASRSASRAACSSCRACRKRSRSASFCSFSSSLAALTLRFSSSFFALSAARPASRSIFSASFLCRAPSRSASRSMRARSFSTDTPAVLSLIVSCGMMQLFISSGGFIEHSKASPSCGGLSARHLGSRRHFSHLSHATQTVLGLPPLPPRA